MVPQNLFMLALFGDFYRKTYMGTKKDASTAIPMTDEKFYRDVQGLCATKIPNVELRKCFTDAQERQAAAKLSAADDGTSSQTNNSSPDGIPYERKRIIDNPTINGNFLRDVHYT